MMTSIKTFGIPTYFPWNSNLLSLEFQPTFLGIPRTSFGIQNTKMDLTWNSDGNPLNLTWSSNGILTSFFGVLKSGKICVIQNRGIQKSKSLRFLDHCGQS